MRDVPSVPMSCACRRSLRAGALLPALLLALSLSSCDGGDGGEQGGPHEDIVLPEEVAAQEVSEVSCIPDCDGKECGPDGCGGTCGGCDDEILCTDDECVEGECSSVIQEGSCFIAGACHPSGEASSEAPCLICDPDASVTWWSEAADGTPCGAEGVCTDGSCCVPACVDLECGPDGCGGTCGDCVGDQECADGLCVLPDSCVGRCGEDALTCYCSNCDLGGCCDDFCEACPDDPFCLCQPSCDGKQCGDDGCGGVCGMCEVSLSPCLDISCQAGLCVETLLEVSCDDLNPCTVEDLCVDGSCVGTPLPADEVAQGSCSCTIDEDCAALDMDLCDGVFVCDPDAEGGPVCVADPDSAPDCDDGDPCTLDLCDPLEGCTNPQDLDWCDDGNECTSDSCVSGACVNEPVSDGTPCVAIPGKAECEVGVCVGVPMDHLWSQAFGAVSEATSASDVAWNSAGNIVVLLDTETASINVGGDDLPAGGMPGVNDLVLAEYSPGGAHVWSERIGGWGQELPIAMTLDGDDNIYVTGWNGDTGVEADLGAGAPAECDHTYSDGVARYNLFVGKLGPDGAHIWSQLFCNDESQLASDIAVGTDGSVLVGGRFEDGEVDFGMGALPYYGKTDGFVLKLDPDGIPVWAHAIGGTDYDGVKAVAMDSQGRAYAGGYGRSSMINFGSEVSGISVGGYPEDFFLVRYSVDGVATDYLLNEDSFDQSIQHVSVLDTGEVFVAGLVDNSIQIGGMSASLGSGYAGVFYALLDEDLNPVFVEAQGGAGNPWIGSMAAEIGMNGVFYLGGYVTGEMDFGGGPITENGGSGDGYVLAAAQDGSFLWSMGVASPDWEQVTALAMSPDGDLAIVGRFSGIPVDLGGGFLPVLGDGNGFLAVYGESD